MSKAKDIEAAYIHILDNEEPDIDFLHDCIAAALREKRQARESVDLEQLREALQSAGVYYAVREPSSQAEAEVFESVRIIGQAAQAWLDFMEGAE